MPKYIHVANLPVKAEASDLEDFCTKHGQVTDVKRKGTKAVVTMESGGESAAKALTGHQVHGTRLEVTIHHDEILEW